MIDTASLATRLASRARLTLEGDRRAGVLVPLIAEADGPALLLTRRTETVGTHRGQVAFPGGRVDPEDADLIETALREADEEIGLARGELEVVGMLDDVIARGSVVVTPTVAWLPGRPTLEANPAEVARIFTIPLAAMQIAEGWRTQTISWKGRHWPMYFFDYDGETLWGVSAYITLKLLGFLPGGAPFDPPDTDPGRL